MTPTPTTTTKNPSSQTPTTVPTTRVQVPVPGPGIPTGSATPIAVPPGTPTNTPGGFGSVLAQTGANSLWAIGIGLGLLVLGAFILVASKRRGDE